MNRIILIKKILFLKTLFLASAIILNAQINQPQNEPLDSPDTPLKCAEWHNYINDAVQRWGENKDSSIIIIARLGDGETSRRLNLRRIKVLRDYMSNPQDKIKTVFAEGERTRGYGVAEFYVGGKLLYSLPIRRNYDMVKDFCP